MQQANSLRISNLNTIKSEVAICTKCVLATEGRIQPVFGNGKEISPDFMFVGEGPGAEEDRCGIPFSGPAGRQLDKLLTALGYGRDAVFVDNVVKCRPLQNRTPKVSECKACFPYLEAEIENIQPKVLICVGKPAAQTILGLKGPMYQLNGTWHKFKGIPTTIIYHPAYWMRLENIDRQKYVEVKKAVWGVMTTARKYV